MSITADLVAGRPVAEKDGVLHLQAKTFQVAAVEKMQSDLDGEVGPLLPLTIETIPQAIAVYC
jgi:diacylglycerol kinase family enzyme